MCGRLMAVLTAVALNTMQAASFFLPGVCGAVLASVMQSFSTATGAHTAFAGWTVHAGLIVPRHGEADHYHCWFRGCTGAAAATTDRGTFWRASGFPPAHVCGCEIGWNPRGLNSVLYRVWNVRVDQTSRESTNDRHRVAV